MLARSPELIILDEPFTSLDKASQKQSIMMLKETYKEQCILFTSHQRYIYAELGSRFFLLENRQQKEMNLI